MIEARVYCLKREKLKKKNISISLSTVPAPSGVTTKPPFPPHLFINSQSEGAIYSPDPERQKQQTFDREREGNQQFCRSCRC